MKPIMLVGGGGHCKSVIEAAESSGRQIKGILDLPQNIGTKILNYEVVGSDADIFKYAECCDFIVTLGFIKNPDLRLSLHQNILHNKGKLATIIAPTAHVSKYSTIADGTVVLHNANINADANVGSGVIINTEANIEHDVIIGDYSHISTGVMVNGNCKIGKNSFIGSGTIIVNNISICDNCIIGAGSVVINNITESGTYVGSPVKKVR